MSVSGLTSSLFGPLKGTEKSMKGSRKSRTKVVHFRYILFVLVLGSWRELNNSMVTKDLITLSKKKKKCRVLRNNTRHYCY